MNPLAEILERLGFLALTALVLYAGAQFFEARGYDRAHTEYQTLPDQQKRTADTLLQEETDRTHRAEQALADFKTQQDHRDANHSKKILAQGDRLRHLADSDGRLRDPNAAGCRPGRDGTAPADPSAARPGAANAAETGCVLSAELSDLLRRLAREADDVNGAYASCRADAFSLRSRLTAE